MLQKIRVLFLVAAWISVLFLPLAVLTEEKTPPELNPVCWMKEDCVAQRKEFGVPEDKGEALAGWLKNEDPCDSPEWGKCLPAGKTKTSISFGAKTEFTHIGDYILTVYDYALKIASILAVIVIIIAGAQYVTSGGNSEMVTSAKKRIFGALIGLFIAYTSYLVLNTINPALANLRLPQVYMIRPKAMVTEFCMVMPTSTKFAAITDPALQGGGANQTAKASFLREAYGKLEAKDFNLHLDPSKTDYMSNLPNFDCKNRLFVRGGDGATCNGHYCKPQMYRGVERAHVCVRGGDNYSCVPAMLAGNVGQSGNKALVIDNNMKLIAVCKNGSIKDVADIDVDDSMEPAHYAFAADDELESYCKGTENTLGFYLGIELNDEAGGVGSAIPLSSEGGFLTSGADDWFAVGKTPGTGTPSGATCGLNLAKVVYKIANNTENDPPCKDLECSCSYVSIKEYRKTALDNSNFKNALITLEELKNGFKCDIVLDRQVFPDVANVMVLDDPTSCFDQD